jgi:hypothetical protein
MLYITDVSTNLNSRIGDWQYGGTGILPDKICGLWFYSVKNMLSNTPNPSSIYFLLIHE